MEKYQNFATNIFSSEKCDCFWWFWPKNWNGWSDNLQTFHKEKSGVVERKPRKRKFYPGSSSLWKLIFKKKQIFSTIFQARISNILKYFLSETIHAQENGSWGTHFAKSLVSNFLKGLTYSALSDNKLSNVTIRLVRHQQICGNCII